MKAINGSTIFSLFAQRSVFVPLRGQNLRPFFAGMRRQACYFATSGEIRNVTVDPVLGPESEGVALDRGLFLNIDPVNLQREPKSA